MWELVSEGKGREEAEFPFLSPGLVVSFLDLLKVVLFLFLYVMLGCTDVAKLE
jgi:hypothetical protein